MKKKIKILLMLLFVSGFIFNSCDKDFEVDELLNKNQKSDNSNLKVSKVYFNDFKKNTELLNKIAKSIGKNKIEQNQRIVHSTDNSFYIDTDFAYFIEDENGKHSYTFQMIRQNPLYRLENLILKENDSSGYNLYIAQYDITELEYEQLQNGENPTIINKLNIVPVANNIINTTNIFSRGSGEFCLTETIIPGNTCPGREHHTLGDVLGGAICPYFNGGGFSLYAQQTIFSWGPCVHDAGGGDGGDPVDGGNNDNIDNTGGNVNTTPTYTSNTIKKPCEEIKKITDKPQFVSNMQALKDNINGTKEKGFIIRDKVGTDAFSPIIEGDNKGNVTYPYFDSTPAELALLFSSVGTAHNHIITINTQIGIFTPEDLESLVFNGLIETHPQNPNLSTIPKKSVIFVITDKGFFALKINDLAKLVAFTNSYRLWTKEKTDEYMKEVFQDPDVYNIRPESSHDDQVIGFLRFIEDQDIGIDLYKGDKNNFNNFSKLSLTNFGYGEEPYSFVSTPCN